MQERSSDTVPRPEPPRRPALFHGEQRPSQREVVRPSQRELVRLSLLLRPDAGADDRR